MKLIIGLGNIGKEYENTRHNIGFMALDFYLGDVLFKTKDNYCYFEKNINGEKVLFVKPLIFMNNSGLAIKNIVNYYKVSLDDMLVIYDDMDFDLGTFKLKKEGSSAGHNGIKSIINELNTKTFNRLRIGISKSNFNTIDYVLGKFTKDEMNILKEEFIIINSILDDFITLNFDNLMNKYNK